jgi:hypothetical protein
VGVNAEHYPLIFPVNYALDRGVIVIRTHPGTMLSAAGHANVTFEVDEVDRRTRSGWSVLVRGLAEEVTSAHREELIERTRASGAQPWAPGEHGRWMRIIPQASAGGGSCPGSCRHPSVRRATCDGVAGRLVRARAGGCGGRRHAGVGLALQSTLVGIADPAVRDRVRRSVGVLDEVIDEVRSVLHADRPGR